MAWVTERPDQSVYQKYYQNIGKYQSNLGKPYINPNVPMFVPNDGENCIRIVDPLEVNELKIWFFDVEFHRDVGFRKDYFLCLVRHNLGPCGVCENSSNDLWQQDKEAAKDLLPQIRKLVWVLDLKKPDEAHILKLWSAPRTLVDEILTQSRDPELDIYKEVSHPFEGVPVYFNRTGMGRNTKYTGVKLGTNPYPLTEEIDQQRFFFMDVLIIPTYEEVSASYHMTDLPQEANPESPPTSAYENTAEEVPPHEVPLQESAQAASSPPPADPGGTTGEKDFSDLKLIQPENKDCFRNEFDVYDDCVPCVDRVKCSQPWPIKAVKKKKPKPVPKNMPTKPQRQPVSSQSTPPSRLPPTQSGGPGTPAGAGNTTAGPSSNASKIQAAQEKLRADILRRKGQL